MGESATIPTIAALTEPADPYLDENLDVPEDIIDFDSTKITVRPAGRAVPYSELLEDLSYYDITNQVQRRLRDQMQLSVDTAIATAAKLCKLKYAPTGVGTYNLATTGTFGAAGTAPFNVTHAANIRDILFGTYLAPMRSEGGEKAYLGIFATKSMRGVWNDPAWVDWHKYTTPDKRYNNERGIIENIRLVESNHSNAFSNSAGTGGVVGEGLVFAEEALAYVEAIPLELRAYNATPNGLRKAVMWYTVFGVGIKANTANAGEARVIHFGST